MKKQIVALLAGAMLVMGMAAIANATVIDLTNASNSAIYTGITASDGSIWKSLTSPPTGTGVYQPFERLQMNGSESGFNTDAAKVLDNKDGIWTHSLTFGDLTPVTKGSSTYYSFTLDINEPDNAKGKLLSLTDFKIFAYNGALGGYATQLSQLGTALYDFTNSTPIGAPTLMDYTLSGSGSGTDDIEVLIPTSYFVSAKSTDFFYLYSQFGSEFNSVDYTSDAGFEEWHTVLKTTPPPAVPEPGTMMLLGIGMLGMAVFGKRRMNKA